MAGATHRPPYRYMLGRLIAARKAARLTQAAVAEALGTTQTSISKIERGERRIDPVELAEFAALYDQELDHFLLKPHVRPPAVPKTIELPAEDVLVLEALAEAHGEDEEAILRRALKALASTADGTP